MISANLSWKNPNEVETVGQHREQKIRQRNEDSKSSRSSTASSSYGPTLSSSHGQRPRTRDTTNSRVSSSRTIKRKASKNTIPSKNKDSGIPNPPTLPSYVGTDALSLFFPPHEVQSLYDLESTPSIASTSNSTDGRRDSNAFLSVGGAPPSSRRTSVCSIEQIVSESVLNEVQELGPDSKVCRVTTVTVTASNNNSERAESTKERSSEEGSRHQLQLPRRTRSTRSLGSPTKFVFEKSENVSPPSPEPKSLGRSEPTDAEVTAREKKKLAKLLELQSVAVQQIKGALRSPSTWKAPDDWQTPKSGFRGRPAVELPGSEAFIREPSPRPSTHSGTNITPIYHYDRNDVPATPPLSLYAASRNQTQTSLATPLQIRPSLPPQQPPLQSGPATRPFTRTLRRMEIATPAVLTQHVAESWDSVVDASAAAEVTDDDGLANVREEFDFEKRLWALTALGRLRFRDRLAEGAGGAGESGMVDKCILNLYGLEADTWFLATKNHRSTVHSLSHNTNQAPNPSHPWGRPPPNCRPLTSPLTATTSPYPPATFDLVISRSLPAILRSTDYPPFLRDCARILKTSGHLLISFVDPSPKDSGPLMLRWTEGLKLKLERQFRCTRPSDLLPYWLGEVGGWANRVEVETMDWVAVEGADGDDQWDALRSVTGRAVYRKLYEDFVDPEVSGVPRVDSGVWWWEDPAIVEECRSLGTTFQLYRYLCQKE
ncbi:hypothetical protein FGG08_007057 [Glutinoglossum americanum]|uniref:Methyltransferase type 11 domain-containing protein n=1 Tax=Glutinoglossum americanum TaxID=1670608 RepID=A0A9P8I278_9PEZI|nr:hypothetical protein FGG08_007057 [Glutinoglossum americanum]